MSFNSVHMEGFDELSQTQIQAFDSFVRYAQSQGTTVILVLSPWHPYLYGYLLTEPENHKGFFQVENWLRQYCADNNVPIYGSYDPRASKACRRQTSLTVCTAAAPALPGSSPASPRP